MSAERAVATARLTSVKRVLSFLRALAPEQQVIRLLAASVLLGGVVGFLISLLQWVVLRALLESVEGLPIWAAAISPFFGLAIATLTLRTIGRGITPSTSDEHIRAYHEEAPYLSGRNLTPRLIAGIATIGLGGAVGLEGPSIYTGSVVGLKLSRRLRKWLGNDSAKVLMTAGAAAAVASLFQAPATGVVFALEAPYRDDLANRALLPSLLASAAAYLAFISTPLVQAERVLPFAFDSGVGTAQIVGAIAIGLGAGFGGRAYAWCVRRAKAIAADHSAFRAVMVGGILLALLAVISNEAAGDPITLGPGVATIRWLLEDQRPIIMVLLVFILRAMATFVTVGAGGTGGFFIPLAVQGVLFGTVVGNGLESIGVTGVSGNLWPVLGLAAFLGAGYRTPLAAVMFVAESTGGGAVVPALIAAAVSQLVAGPSSVATGQKVERTGLVEGKANSPVGNVLKPVIFTVTPDSTVYEFIHNLAIGQQLKTVPVVDGAQYVGLCTVAACAGVEREKWPTTLIAEVVDRTVPPGSPHWNLRDAMVAMRKSEQDMLAIVGDDNVFLGVVSAEDIVRLEEIIAVTQ